MKQTNNLDKFEIFTIPVDPTFRKAQSAHKSVQLHGGMKFETSESIKKIAESLRK